MASPYSPSLPYENPYEWIKKEIKLPHFATDLPSKMWSKLSKTFINQNKPESLAKQGSPCAKKLAS